MEQQPLPARRRITGASLGDIARVRCGSFDDSEHHRLGIFRITMKDFDCALMQVIATTEGAEQFAGEEALDDPNWEGHRPASPTSSCTAASAACWKRSRAS